MKLTINRITKGEFVVLHENTKLFTGDAKDTREYLYVNHAIKTFDPYLVMQECDGIDKDKMIKLISINRRVKSACISKCNELDFNIPQINRIKYILAPHQEGNLKALNCDDTLEVIIMPNVYIDGSLSEYKEIVIHETVKIIAKIYGGTDVKYYHRICKLFGLKPQED